LSFLIVSSLYYFTYTLMHNVKSYNNLESEYMYYLNRRWQWIKKSYCLVKDELFLPWKIYIAGISTNESL